MSERHSCPVAISMQLSSAARWVPAKGAGLTPAVIGIGTPTPTPVIPCNVHGTHRATCGVLAMSRDLDAPMVISR